MNELEEMKKAFDNLTNSALQLNEIVKRLSKENEELKEEIKEYRWILDTQKEREFHSKFLKDFQKEKGENVFPDHDEVYRRYDNYKDRTNKAIEYIENKLWNYFNERHIYLKVRDELLEILDKVGDIK